jgi:hypothetical protein
MSVQPPQLAMRPGADIEADAGEGDDEERDGDDEAGERSPVERARRRRGVDMMTLAD